MQTHKLHCMIIIYIFFVLMSIFQLVHPVYTCRKTGTVTNLKPCT